MILPSVRDHICIIILQESKELVMVLACMVGKSEKGK